MNKNISDMFDYYEGQEKVTEDISFSAERIKEMTMGRLGERRPRRGRRKALRTALIAAAIMSAFTVTALAVSGGIFHHEPEEGEVYVDNMFADYGFVAEWDDVAIILRFDVEQEGKAILFRPGWLPEEPNRRTINFRGQSAGIFRDKARNESYYELLEEAGVPEKDRDGWCTRMELDKEGDMLYQITVYDVSELYKSDCVIGMQGGEEAGIIKEGELNGCSLLELTMEHSDGQAWQNYVILFDRERNFMLRIGGTLGMEVLEKIAEDIEVLETEHTITAEEPEEGIWNRTLINVARG